MFSVNRQHNILYHPIYIINVKVCMFFFPLYQNDRRDRDVIWYKDRISSEKTHRHFYLTETRVKPLSEASQ